MKEKGEIVYEKRSQKDYSNVF